MAMIRRRRALLGSGLQGRWADFSESNYPVGTPNYEVPALYPDGIIRWLAAGSVSGGLWEPETALDEDGVPGVEFAINGDGEWDLIMVWRGA
jgi:hypothetical protein